MSVTPDDVRHVAQLARLGVPDARVPALVNELNSILVHMQVLQDVRLDDVTFTSSLTSEHGMPLRDDVPDSVSLQRARESLAPAMRDGFFLVPRLATHGTAGVGNAPIDNEDGE